MKKGVLVSLLCILPASLLVAWIAAGKNLQNLALFALVLACPLSHAFFMRHEHHDHNQRTKGGEKQDE